MSLESLGLDKITETKYNFKQQKIYYPIYEFDFRSWSMIIEKYLFQNCHFQERERDEYKNNSLLNHNCELYSMNIIHIHLNLNTTVEFNNQDRVLN